MVYWTFSATVEYGAGNTPLGISSFDVSGDEVLDLIVASSVSDTASVLPGLEMVHSATRSIMMSA